MGGVPGLPIGAILLNLPEIGEIRRLFHPEQPAQQKELSSRERGELDVKLDRLGILYRQKFRQCRQKRQSTQPICTLFLIY